MNNQAMRKPDIEFVIKKKGFCRSYGHIYFKPFIVNLFGKTIIGKKHLQEEVDKSFKHIKINCPIHKYDSPAVVLKSGTIWCKKCHKLKNNYE